jgi:predicted Zn-dependent protease
MSPVAKPYEIVERALELSRADGCVVIADEQSSANLRWAGNALTTNGVTRGRTLTVIATVDGAEGTASGVVSRSAVTAEELEPLVRAAEAAARGAGPAEDAQPLVTGGQASPDFTDAPAETSSTVFADFAPALGEAFARARAAAGSCTGSRTTS